jgi:peptidyl-prolyl cis-trans isomerase SurA
MAYGRSIPLRRMLAVALIAGFATPAYAQLVQQRPAPPVQLRASPTPQAAQSTDREVLLDRVIAVVNDEAITQHDLNEQRVAVLVQLRESKIAPPAPDVLERQVLERMITERSLLQFAKETGVRIDDTTVERAVLRIAQDNKVTPEEFRKVLDREGIPYAKYREDIRRELTMQRLREREVESRVMVTDAEVDNFLASTALREGGDIEYLLSHILVSVPEQSSPEQVAQRRRRADEALQQVRSGGEFAQIAASTSDAPDALQGASLGWRTAARLPTAFADLVRDMKKGDISQILRSPAGFHIVKLVDQRDRSAPTVVDQTRVRHILVRVNETTSEAEARARIDRVTDRLETGAKFEDMARINSEDATSAKGGDLGWVNPGDTVPEFEQAMAKLGVGETSRAVRTPFGWHLLKVEERRKQDITRDRRREQARQALRQRKADELFSDFVRQTRDRAYVELKIDER